MLETESPGDLIGRTVTFVWSSWCHKPLKLRGKVICAGRNPDTVVIKSDAQPLPVHKKYSRQKVWSERVKKCGALHCRSIDEIEVVA